MLYERAIRACYENSISKFIENLKYITDCTSKSIDKDISQNDVTEKDVL